MHASRARGLYGCWTGQFVYLKEYEGRQGWTQVRKAVLYACEIGRKDGPKVARRAEIGSILCVADAFWRSFEGKKAILLCDGIRK